MRLSPEKRGSSLVCHGAGLSCPESDAAGKSKAKLYLPRSIQPIPGPIVSNARETMSRRLDLQDTLSVCCMHDQGSGKLIRCRLSGSRSCCQTRCPSHLSSSAYELHGLLSRLGGHVCATYRQCKARKDTHGCHASRLLQLWYVGLDGLKYMLARAADPYPDYRTQTVVSSSV